ncbi:MAG: TVP38/TMEM64 family protein [Clostridia bacterium]|nr:TVP38/TMEM64 family protein [Clostridia bacterium]
MKSTLLFKILLSIIAVSLLGIAILIFTQLYLKTFSYGFIYNYRNVILYSVTASVFTLGILAIVFSLKDKVFIYKLSIVVLTLIVIVVAILYFLKSSGFLNKINSIEALRNYVASFGYLAVFIFILMNFLQVVVLPIPGFIAVGTGVALFGVLKAFVFSFIGILLGSLVAFIIGRWLGYKVVSWLVGENTLKKWLKAVKNKDKLILTFMFLFPFFPDDVLCFIAGLSSMSTGYFIIMIIICRLISVSTTAYSINGSIIPYTTWWGISLWVVILLLTVCLTLQIYKNGDKIEKHIKNKLKKLGKKNESNTSR